MKCKVEIKKTLRTDNDKWFSVGSDIAFTIPNTETNHLDRYIGEIKDIREESFVIENIEIDRNRIRGELEVLYEDIIRNSCGYVYCD